MDISYILKDLFRTKNLQEWVNHRFKDDSKVILSKNSFDRVITKTKEAYYISDFINTVEQVKNEYIFDDIRKDDIVIDIGANIGGFCIPASKLSDHVYAVEPLTTKELKRNIELNNADINVIESALGNGTTMKIKWVGLTKSIKTMTLSEIISSCGGCDFLKCDCEGGEWFIQPDEIIGIRRIEREYHKFNTSGKS